MQPIPGCRIRVWKKEWQQTVGSQTSLTTGTRRIANRIEQRSRRERKRGKQERRGDVLKAGAKGQNIGKEKERDEGIKEERWDAERLMGNQTTSCG